MADVNVRSVDAWVEVDDTPETRAEGDGTILRLRGYAVVFDTKSERMGSMVETIDKRAFDEVMSSRELDVRMLEQHDGTPLARTTNDTMRLEVDDKGLRFEADLDARSQRARDLYFAVERGDISQMSFGFVIGAEEHRGETEDGLEHWHVTKVDRLLEVSAVTFPAYQPTSVEAERMDTPEEEGDDADEMCEACGERGEDCRCGKDRSLRVDQLLRRLDLG